MKHTSNIKFKKNKKTTAGTRNKVKVINLKLFKGRPVKKLTIDIKKRTSLNHKGQRIGRRIRGAKRLYRIIDFKRRDFNIKFQVLRLEYDPNRTSFIALIESEDKKI